MGLLWDKSSPAFLGLELSAAGRRTALARLAAADAVRPVRIEGLKPVFYYRAEDEALMQSVLAGTADLSARMAFLAPLDPMLWDKAMIAALWDFRYAWEIYTPSDKRRYGPYTLPILYGESFVGRIDAAADRKSGVLRVRGLWWEPGIRQTKTLQSALDRALRRFAAFNGCTQYELLF